ncbi:MAG: helix-turn-helix domain-containing protein [Clostridiales bacterium]|nr:helix-turn-helix domain-containing protein [Clostridiales bacterium]
MIDIIDMINYCENKLDQEITIEELAAKAGYSVFHFCRLFQLATGWPPMEYIRKRRLSQAALELLNSNRRIGDIGFKWGFNSHENFIRAFKKQFGIAPSRYRETKSSLNLICRIVRLNPYFDEDLYLEPELIDRPSFKLAGFICHTTWQDGANRTDVPKHWNNYHADRLYDRIGRKTESENRYDIGMVMGCDFVKRSFSYIIGLEVDDFDGINEECTRMVVPAARYVVFKTPSANTETFVWNIQKTWSYIHHVWMPCSGYRYTGTHEFETYCEASRTFSEKIWIPIERSNKNEDT